MTARSWIESANAPHAPFPLQNLPYGVFRRTGERPRCGVAIGDHVLDLARLEAQGLLSTGQNAVFDRPALNDFMAQGTAAWEAVRSRLTALLAADGDSALREDRTLRDAALVPLAAVELLMPFKVAGLTAFNGCWQHAFNTGSMLHGEENALPANWLHIPAAYTGRASTVVVSGTGIRRPLGQQKPRGLDAPVFGASRRLDFELELGAVLGLPSTMGEPLTVAEADALIFGYVLLNDWSARDIQGWESQPMGPFQGKVFATTISPWVVTKAALQPFRVSTPPRETPLLPYLREPGPMLYDIDLEIALRPAEADRATVISRSNHRHLYYSAPQQVAHHAIGGCAMETGDLIGSGTVSGPGRAEWGSLLELSRAGREPLTLAAGEQRSFLQDGDTVILAGRAQGDGYVVGFGECSGTILPAPAERDW